MISTRVGDPCAQGKTGGKFNYQLACDTIAIRSHGKVSASNEYFDYHLTPRGWVDGDESKDFVGETKRSVPSDRELTVRFSERMSSVYSDMERNLRVIWHSGNREEVSRLISNFGYPPHPYADKFYGIEQLDSW
jgi:hypothetical protein